MTIKDLKRYTFKAICSNEPVTVHAVFYKKYSKRLQEEYNKTTFREDRVIKAKYWKLITNSSNEVFLKYSFLPDITYRVPKTFEEIGVIASKLCCKKYIEAEALQEFILLSNVCISLDNDDKLIPLLKVIKSIKEKQ